MKVQNETVVRARNQFRRDEGKETIEVTTCVDRDHGRFQPRGAGPGKWIPGAGTGPR